MAGASVAVAQLACVLAIVVSWRVVAERADVADQAVWLNVAVAGAVVSAALNGAGLLRLRRAVAARRRALLAHLDAATSAGGMLPRADIERPTVSVPGMLLAHRPSCALVTGKLVEPANDASERCGWCRP